MIKVRTDQGEITISSAVSYCSCNISNHIIE